MRTLLAGPLLRRVDAHRACVWLATSEPVTTRVTVFRVVGGTPQPVGEGEGSAVRIGQRLWVHLVQARPTGGGWPTDELLAYDVSLRAAGDADGRGLAALGLLDGDRRIAYRGLPLPTFVVRERLPDLNALHGSCRLFHGLGEDAFRAADAEMARHAHLLYRRPSVMFLTGDQI